MNNYRPFVLALLAFPFLSLKMFVWPGPVSFAREKDKASWVSPAVLSKLWAALAGGSRSARSGLPALRRAHDVSIIPLTLFVRVC